MREVIRRDIGVDDAFVECLFGQTFEETVTHTVLLDVQFEVLFHLHEGIVDIPQLEGV